MRPPFLDYFSLRRDSVLISERYWGGRKIDIWRPPTPTDPAPVLLFIPGGAWMIGHRRGQGYPLMAHMVRKGWICAAIDYRTAPRHRWPAPLDDARSALDWLQGNIANYGGSKLIAVAGASAGGHLASLLGLAWDYTDYPVDRPDAAISLYGVYDWEFRGTPFHDTFVRVLETVVVGHRQVNQPNVFREASPVNHIRPDAPPFCIVHGTRDWLTPVSGARIFQRRLREVSEKQVRYLEISGAVHGFDLVNPTQTRDAVEQIGNFLDDVRRSYELRRWAG